MQQQQPHRRGIKLVLILLCLLVYALVYVCVWVRVFFPIDSLLGDIRMWIGRKSEKNFHFEREEQGFVMTLPPKRIFFFIYRTCGFLGALLPD